VPPAPGERREREPQAQSDSQGSESRSKRRREKRKRRRDQNRGEKGPQPHGHEPHARREPHQRNDNRQEHRPEHRNDNRQEHRGGQQHRNDSHDQQDRSSASLSGPKIEADGMLELAPKGFGFLRVPNKNFEQARDDIFVTPELIRRNHLRLGQWIHGLYQQGPRGPQLVEITSINGMTPEEASKLPHFDELKAINPTKRISFETTPERFTTRVVDIMSPVGRGQRGLIVSPPRSGKTTLLLHMAEAIRTKYEESMHLMVLLVDERPEEVTEFRRALPGAEIYASSNDENARNHCRIAELAIERAKRLVEAGKDVFLHHPFGTRLQWQHEQSGSRDGLRWYHHWRS
jgi:transcription termination factor Rho